MTRYILRVILYILLSANMLAAAEPWHITKSTHFIVHYQNAPAEFIDKLISQAEDYYSNIADDLGFRRYNFWLWDNRANIYIYDDSKAYQEATGQPAWSSGSANVKDKVINSFPYAEGFFDSILPHEMGHIIFREFIGFDNPALPLWLDEGVASYEESLRHPAIAYVIKEALAKNKLISLDELSKIDLQSVQDKDTVGLFYAESVSVIDYLIKEFGKDDFIHFCQALRDKRSLEAALSAAYPFKNITELSQAWEKHLRNE